MEKKKITIEVEPATAVATVGLLRGIFPSIIEQLERQAATNGSPLKFNKVENGKSSVSCPLKPSDSAPLC